MVLSFILIFVGAGIMGYAAGYAQLLTRGD